MQPLRARRADVAADKARDLVRRVGRELRIARVVLGISQGTLAKMVGISQSTVSDIERGRVSPDVAMLSRLADATGMSLRVLFYPNGSVRLRDSGQLAIAQALVSQAHPIWAPSLEQPVAAPPDLRAADLVLAQPLEVLDIEIERNVADLQAQMRAGMLKRDALAKRHTQPVRFILVLPDTARLRRIVDELSLLLAPVLPKTSREILVSIRTGKPLGGDGLLWVRESRLAPHPRVIA